MNKGNSFTLFSVATTLYRCYEYNTVLTVQYSNHLHYQLDIGHIDVFLD